MVSHRAALIFTSVALGQIPDRNISCETSAHFSTDWTVDMTRVIMLCLVSDTNIATQPNCCLISGLLD